jgi:hypothetical protein
MGRVKCRDAASDRENEIREATHAYRTGLEPSIRAAASTYGIPYGTLRDRLRGAQPRGAAHEKEQLLTPEEEKSIVRFCETLDDLGHPLQGKMVKAFAMSLLPSHRRRQLGKHWMTRFLNRHPAITTKFSQRLDRQRANANDPAILKDFFRKVYHFSIYINFQLILVTVAWKTCQKAQCTTRKHIQYG